MREFLIECFMVSRGDTCILFDFLNLSLFKNYLFLFFATQNTKARTNQLFLKKN